MDNVKIYKRMLCSFLAMLLLVGQIYIVFAKDEAVIAENVPIPEYNDKSGDVVFKTNEAVHVDVTEFTDIENEKLAKIVGVLAELDFVKGFEDGTFKPTSNVSRIECALVLLKMINYSNSFQYECGFYDVSKDNPMRGVIAAASNLGLIKGYNDNTFRPQQPIEVNEWIALVVRVMGYGYLADEKGGYPTGYMLVANDLGLLNDVSSNKSNLLTRETMAKIVFKALKTPVFKNVSLGKNIDYSTDKDVTMLSEYHNIYTSFGVVTGTCIASTDNSKTSKNMMRVGNTEFNIKNSSFNSFLGYKVDYYYREEKDLSSDTILYMSKHKDVEEIVIKAENVQSYSNSILSYFDENDSLKHAKIANVNNVIKNGKHIMDYDATVFKPKNGIVKLISNNGENVYDLIMVETFENIVLKYIGADNNIIQLDSEFNLKPIEIDLADKNIYLDLIGADGRRIDFNVSSGTTYNADGKAITYVSLPPIPVGSLLSIYADKYEDSHGYNLPSKDATYYKIIINDKSVEGEITAISDDNSNSILTIGDKDYDVSSSNFLYQATNKIKIGSKGTFLLDVEGKVSAWKENKEANANEFKYGYLIRCSIKQGVEGLLQMKILKTDGEKENFDCTDKVLLVGETKKLSPSGLLTKLQDSARFINKDTTGTSQLIKYKVNSSGKISEVETVTASLGVIAGFDKEHLRRDYVKTQFYSKAYSGYTLYKALYSGDDFGASLFGKPLIYFVVPDVETNNDKDYDIFVKWLPDEAVKSVEVYDCSNVKVPNVAIVYESAAPVTLNSDLDVMVDKIVSIVNDEGESVAKLYGCDGNKMVEYEGETLTTFDGLVQGDLIRVNGKKGVVTQCVIVKRLSELTSIESSPSTGFTAAIRREYSEVFLVEGRFLRLGRGAKNTSKSDGERDYERVFYWTTNKAVMKNGGIIYDAENPAKPVVRVAQMADIKEAYKVGSANASRVYTYEGYAEPRGIVIYNGLN